MLWISNQLQGKVTNFFSFLLPLGKRCEKKNTNVTMCGKFL
jgi:hypothetical protein